MIQCWPVATECRCRFIFRLLLFTNKWQEAKIWKHLTTLGVAFCYWRAHSVTSPIDDVTDQCGSRHSFAPSLSFFLARFLMVAIYSQPFEPRFFGDTLRFFEPSILVDAIFQQRGQELFPIPKDSSVIYFSLFFLFCCCCFLFLKFFHDLTSLKRFKGFFGIFGIPKDSFHHRKSSFVLKNGNLGNSSPLHN